MSSGEPAPFVHERALCESDSVGANTRVWAFAHILPGARIGRNCNICDGVFVEGDVVVGDDVTVKCGVQLWDGVRLGDRVFVGPNATFTNDLRPRSKVYPDRFASTVVEEEASIGANATILPGVTIGRGAMVGAGAVVTRDVPPNATVVGNPAVVVGYGAASDAPSPSASSIDTGSVTAGSLGSKPGDTAPLGRGGSYLMRVPHFEDMRGGLIPLEKGRGALFAPARVFLVRDVPTSYVRGEHAHRRCEQFLIAAHGTLAVVVDDGQERAEVRLADPSVGLYLPPMVWGIQYKFQRDTVLMVLASHPYEAEDYIRDYDEFLALVGALNGPNDDGR